MPFNILNQTLNLRKGGNHHSPFVADVAKTLIA